MQVKNSVALVTGANRGIGRALVEVLLQRGASRVYATGRDVPSLNAVAQLDSRIRTIKLDVKSAADARAAAEQAKDVTLLIHNAAILSLGGVADVPLDDVRENIETNFFGTLNVINAFVPVIEKQHGSIVNMLTMVALASMRYSGRIMLPRPPGGHSRRPTARTSRSAGSQCTPCFRALSTRTWPARSRCRRRQRSTWPMRRWMESRPARKTSSRIRCHASCIPRGDKITRRSSVTSRNVSRKLLAGQAETLHGPRLLMGRPGRDN